MHNQGATFIGAFSTIHAAEPKKKLWYIDATTPYGITASLKIKLVVRTSVYVRSFINCIIYICKPTFGSSMSRFMKYFVIMKQAINNARAMLRKPCVCCSSLLNILNVLNILTKYST